MKTLLSLRIHPAFILIACAGSFTLLGGCGQADTPAPASGAPSHEQGPQTASALSYLPSDAISVENALSPPPADSSPGATLDLSQLMAFQNSRTPSDCARANTEVDISLSAFFGPAYGPLSQTEVARWDSFFDKIGNDVKYFTKLQKNYWERPRPYDADSEIKPCIPLEDSYSYPSGHATTARVYAEVLSLLDPTRKARFEARGDQVGQDRALGGVHYPTDVAAGKKLGDELFTALQSSAAFETDLKQASHP